MARNINRGSIGEKVETRTQMPIYLTHVPGNLPERFARLDRPDIWAPVVGETALAGMAGVRPPEDILETPDAAPVAQAPQQEAPVLPVLPEQL
jgi:hypothetical protein